MSISHSFARTARLSLAAAAVFTAASVTPAFAGPIGDKGTIQVTRQSGYYKGAGGEFTVYGYNGALDNSGYSDKASDIGKFDPSFQTFCLESSEAAVAKTNFEIGSAAKPGGAGAQGGQDPISQGTAWLYSQFATGDLADYFDDPKKRADNALLLQQAIWWLEGEDGNKDKMSNAYYALAVNFFGGKSTAEANATAGQFDVYVLNNTYVQGTGKKAKTRTAQDFLYFAGTPTVSTPDGGATLALLGGALMALGAIRRRFTR
ncbi:MAG: hypothetical protein IT182_14650 [Acidobacteria bacterium]|nr:hypothetical protein [Acidobacteriota bacterium]